MISSESCSNLKKSSGKNIVKKKEKIDANIYRIHHSYPFTLFPNNISPRIFLRKLPFCLVYSYIYIYMPHELKCEQILLYDFFYTKIAGINTSVH